MELETASQYSISWIETKYEAKNTVKPKEMTLIWLDNKLKWNQVTETPLLSKIKELSSGTSPNYKVGVKDESKNNQKILKKNINSLKIKIRTPNLKPSWT